MKSILLLIGLIASTLINAQSLPPIQSGKPDKCSIRNSYSAMARYESDAMWAYSISSQKPGMQRVAVLHVAARNRVGKSESCRHWELPYPDLVVESLNAKSATDNGEVLVSVAAKTLGGKSVTCSLVYGFTAEGVLRSTLTDEGCTDN